MNGLVPAISKVAKEMDESVPLNDVPRGIKTVFMLNKEINEEQLKNSQQNPEKEEKVPTGSEIREAVNEGMYR